MNKKKIGDLLEQAISDVDWISHDDEVRNQDLSEMFIPDFFAERFAELLILECAAFLRQGCGKDGYEEGERLKRHFSISD